MPQLHRVAIIGAGPAGLIAAEKLAHAGFAVTVFDRMQTPARKFLRAGHGGLNLSNAAPLDDFIKRYGDAGTFLEPALRAFPPAALIAWCEDLGVNTFTGTSGRVFPKCMKASPLLRAWRTRLEKLGVQIRLNHRWTGFDTSGALLFTNADGVQERFAADACLLALGGASWPQLGSDAAWCDILRARGIAIHPFRPSNCGFATDWTPLFAERFAGQPVKPVIVRLNDRSIQGELMVTRYGIEGGPVYALSGALRDGIERDGSVLVHLNLRHGIEREALIASLSKPRGSQSLSNHLRKHGGLSPVAIALVQEYLHRTQDKDLSPEAMARLIQDYPLRLLSTGPIERAISSAGGIAREEITPAYELKKGAGLFVAGEMIDWDAPTGGFLLQACFATGVAAAAGIRARLTPDTQT